MPASALSAAVEPAPSVRSIVLYFVGAFAITWGLQFPGVMAQQGLLPGPPEQYMPLVLLGIFGPTFAAMAVCWLESGRSGIKALFRPLRQWRVSVVWYVAALGLQGALLAGGMAVYQLVTGQEVQWFYFPDRQRAVAMFIISFAEEVGWRGFALPRMQRLTTPVRASAILAVLWALWHIPMFMGAHVSLSLLPLMIAMFLPGTLIYTWIFNHSGESLLIAMLTHLGTHLNNSNLPLPGDTRPLVVQTVVFWIVAVVLLLGDRTLRIRPSPQ